MDKGAVGVDAVSDNVHAIAVGTAARTAWPNANRKCANFMSCYRWLMSSDVSEYCPDCNITETHKQTMQALAELTDQVRSLTRTVEELKYAPGLIGYVEARDQFAEDAKELK